MQITAQNLNQFPVSDRRMEAARLLEVSFLEEMLKHSGIAQTPSGFGGGEGESQFSSLLLHEYAERIVDSGGLGLQEALFRAMNRG